MRVHRTSGDDSNGGRRVVNHAQTPQSNLPWLRPIVTVGFDEIQIVPFLFQMYKPFPWANADYTIDRKSSIAGKISYNQAVTTALRVRNCWKHGWKVVNGVVALHR